MKMDIVCSEQLYLGLGLVVTCGQVCCPECGGPTRHLGRGMITHGGRLALPNLALHQCDNNPPCQQQIYHPSRGLEFWPLEFVVIKGEVRFTLPLRKF